MCGRAGRLALAALLLGVAGPASGAETLVLTLPDEVVGLAADAGIGSGFAQEPTEISAVLDDGRRRAVRISGGALELGPPVSRDAADAPPAGILPDGEIARGGGGIGRAWLSEPTGRYGHGVLGDAVEAGALVLEDAAGATHRHVLGAASVFEDRRVRLHDLDGDGRDEAIVVRSYLGEPRSPSSRSTRPAYAISPRFRLSAGRIAG